MLSQKTRYTIRALQHLADQWQKGPVRLDAIAEAQNIPRKFLTVILSELVREGVVISHRGREGGYELALPPVDVRYGDIIRLTRGSLALVPCASRNAHEHCAQLPARGGMPAARADADPARRNGGHAGPADPGRPDRG